MTGRRTKISETLTGSVLDRGQVEDQEIHHEGTKDTKKAEIETGEQRTSAVPPEKRRALAIDRDRSHTCSG